VKQPRTVNAHYSIPFSIQRVLLEELPHGAAGVDIVRGLADDDFREVASVKPGTTSAVDGVEDHIAGAAGVMDAAGRNALSQRLVHPGYFGCTTSSTASGCLAAT
jgi:hypothetical protein